MKTTDQNAWPNLGETLDFLRLIWAVHHAMQCVSKHMDSDIGVTGPQRLVIRIIGRFPGITSGRLAELLHIHPSTLTGVLSRLEDKGLVQRRADPRDGRRTLFGLTKKGRQFDVEKRGTIEAAVQEVLAAGSARDNDATKRRLMALIERFEGLAFSDGAQGKS